ncbi:MAG: sel1 repeat family protein, partial [Deltaproteobacteria bacterium]|nr:sel1 repeat family protein [Deltaproteobacteria bacterium]
SEKGDPVAQNELGERYANGKGVTQDWTEAIKWYRKSAEQGLAMGQCNLGWTCFALGHFSLSEVKGVPGDHTEAGNWLRKAAEQDYPLAQCLLGDLCRSGL